MVKGTPKKLARKTTNKDTPEKSQKFAATKPVIEVQNRDLGLPSKDDLEDTPKKSKKFVPTKPVIEVQNCDLGLPSKDELEDISQDGTPLNRDYIDFTGITRKVCKDILKEEGKVLAWADAGGDLAEWQSNEDFQDTIIANEMADIDPGLMGAVAAVSAIGCCPVTSCNGCPGHWSKIPLLRFWCPAKAWPQVRRAAVSTGVSLKGDGGCGISAYHCDDWRVIREFAKVLIVGR